jgi:hypothetical protein
MAKFLTLCEQLDPQNSSDPKWDLVEFLNSKGIDAVPVQDTDTIQIDIGGRMVSVNLANNEEEAESIEAGYGDYNVNKEVEGLAQKAQSGVKGFAGKLFGTSAQKAKSALGKRQNVAKKAVDVYDRKTRKLEQDLRNVQ